MPGMFLAGMNCPAWFCLNHVFNALPDIRQSWLTEEKKFWGRPVDFEVLPDGSLLVADDFANCIYRISYTAE